MKVTIKNFTGHEEIQIRTLNESQPTVLIVQHSGSSRFQFDMTPNQARECAAALLAGAESFEGVQA